MVGRWRVLGLGRGLHILCNLGLDGIDRSGAWLVHGNFLIGVDVDAKTDLVTIKVVNRVEVTEEGVTNEEQVLILSWQAALVNDEEALALVRLVKVLLRVDFENEVAHLEADGLNLLGYFLARRLNVAESLITVAVKVREGLGPLEADLLKDIGRNGKLRAASIDDGRVAGVFSRLLHGLTSISHTLTLEGPGAKPVVEVLESLQALLAADDLRAVIATKESVRSLIHLL